MASKGTTRPTTNVEVKHFVSGNTQTNAENMMAFIRDNELRRNQIVSLTAHETHVAVEDEMDPESELVLFYRKDSIVPGAMPLDNIQRQLFGLREPWDALQNQANSFTGASSSLGRAPDTIAVVRTPKATGTAHMQTIWYTTEQTMHPASSSLVNRADGDWEGLANNVKEFLNDFVAPHQLISIACFEENHPNTTGRIGAIVTHTAGANPVRLSQTPASRSLPTAGIYKLDCLRGEETSMITSNACTIMNTRGGQEGYKVATSNCCTRGDIFCMVISW